MSEQQFSPSVRKRNLDAGLPAMGGGINYPHHTYTAETFEPFQIFMQIFAYDV